MGSELSESHVYGDEEQPSTITEDDALRGAAATTVSFERPSSEIEQPDVSLDNLSQANLHTAVVHGSGGALPEPDSNTLEANGGIAVFDSETRFFSGITKTKEQKWCAVRRVVKREQTKFDASRFKDIDNLLQRGALCHERQRQRTFRQNNA